MKFKKLLPLWRGLAAVFLSLLIVGTLGYGLADTWRSQLDTAFGTSSYVVNTDEDAARFKSDYATAKDMMDAAKEHAIKQGREGFVMMKNDNDALPISTEKNIALFGAAAWKPYMQSVGDLKAGNADRVNLDDALTAAGYKLDQTMKTIYENILHDYTESSRFGNTTITYNNGYVTSPGDMVDYQIKECPPDEFLNKELLMEDTADWKEVPSNWKDTLAANKSKNVGIVVFARGAGESNTYAPGKAKDFHGNVIDQDPLALSPDELAIVDLAKETCSKVIVLLNTGNAMEIGDISKGGAHEVDAIGYMGVINDYQCTGIVEVLSGQANATGALSDTYAYKNMSAPALMNFGGDEYADADIASSLGTDPRFPGVKIGNGANSSSLGEGAGNYSGGSFIVEAEGIYVGYNYYETRYYDSIMNPSSKANSTKGSTDGEAWSYSDEVVYTFGHGLSYYKYKQEITGVNVDKQEDGNITAYVRVTNESDTDSTFLTQLYVQQPYTDYDKDNKVEKSAVMFLNSKKVEVPANSSVETEIVVPTKYLASYDYTNAKTYILDPGDYLFTVANGAHNAVNNFITHQGKTGDAAATGPVKVWTLGGNTVDKTFAVDNNTNITNVADNADLNYWLPGTVTYLSRSDWDATYPINYNEEEIKIGDSAKKDEWIKEIQGRQYEINANGTEATNVDGKDNGYKFSSEQIGYNQLENIDDPYWDNLVSQISVNESIGAIIHGGGQSDALSIIDNPIVGQNEGVNGIKGSVVEGENEYKYNINSQTLLGTSFNPDLAYEWGILQGNAGIHLKKQAVWGTGLTLRRTPYNGRNYEYISEDAMLTNRIGYSILKGTAEMGLVCGPKHIGFNDQEHNRSGISVYLNEQKFRETDLRGFQGGLSEGGGLAVMVAFNRIGATNASHHVGMLKTILREEWGFTGVISTDLANNKYYFVAESMIMATVTQRAEFGGDNSYISKTNNHSEFDSTYTYISVDSVKNDSVLVNQARENLKYQLYTFANSTVLNISTERVIPAWEAAMIAFIVVSATLAGAAVVAWIVATVLPKKKEA